MKFVYAIILEGQGFVMVFNESRDGWEMPGGSVREGETPVEAVKREVMEEVGWGFCPVDSKELNEGTVFVGRLVKDGGGEGEMRWKAFHTLPDRLVFSEEEYRDVLEWTRRALEGQDGGRGQ